MPVLKIEGPTVITKLKNIILLLINTETKNETKETEKSRAYMRKEKVIFKTKKF